MQLTLPYTYCHGRMYVYTWHHSRSPIDMHMPTDSHVSRSLRVPPENYIHCVLLLLIDAHDWYAYAFELV